MKMTDEVCPTCKLAIRETFYPTKHAKVKARYGPFNSWYWNRKKTPAKTYQPAFKAAIRPASQWHGKPIVHRTSMYCPDPWHDDQTAKVQAYLEAKENAPNPEEQRKEFLARQKKRKEESAIKKKAKAKLHKERQRKR